VNFEAALINVALLWLLTTPHEFAHAWVATKLGDDTPRREGRVTLNPLAHVDWIGTVLLPAVTSLIGAGFLGWGKPVNTNPSRLRGGLNGLALVALAGPASNVVFAVVLAAAAAALAHMNLAAANFAAQGVELSLYLALFNMIPIPPLDGSKLLRISAADRTDCAHQHRVHAFLVEHGSDAGDAGVVPLTPPICRLQF
jgi:Zn-dependent protease